MNDYPTSATPIKTIGLREVCEINGHQFSRRKGTQQWIEVKTEQGPLQPDQSAPLHLSLIHKKQGEGEPLHWSLFVSSENQPGSVYQVKGDAEYMIYQPSTHLIDITGSASFLNLYQLAVVTGQQAEVVKQIADREYPPQAPNRRSVKENCQGWTVRIIAKLVERGIVPSAKLQMARSMMQPV